MNVAVVVHAAASDLVHTYELERTGSVMRSTFTPRQSILVASAGALIVVACSAPGSRAPTTEVSAPGAIGLCAASGATWVDRTGTVALPMDSLRWVNMYATSHGRNGGRAASSNPGTAISVRCLTNTTRNIAVKAVAASLPRSAPSRSTRSTPASYSSARSRALCSFAAADP